MKISKYKYKWIGFTPVRGSGPTAKILRKLGFFRGGEHLGFKWVYPCGLDACSTLGKMRDAGIYGHVARVFCDASWGRQVLTNKELSTNYAD